MGIRIHKILGYGLTDLVENDPRFNKNSLYFDQESDKTTRENYLNWLKNEFPFFSEEKDFEKFDLKKEIKEVEDNPRWNVTDSVFYCTEFGLPNVITIVPCVSRKEDTFCSWYRYDDPIDYAESESGNPHVKVIEHGVFPYNGLYVNALTGKRIKMEFGQIFFYRKRNNLSCEDSFLKEMGFNSVEEADLYLRTLVPPSVKFICKFLKLFNDELTIRQFKAMIYVYWS